MVIEGFRFSLYEHVSVVNHFLEKQCDMCELIVYFQMFDFFRYIEESLTCCKNIKSLCVKVVGT